MRDYTLYLKDILKAISAIEGFVKGLSFNTFASDDKTASAVIRKLEIIGEATKKIPISIRKKYPTVPWKIMAGMRDVLIHGYFAVDYKIVWDTIRKDLPLIKKKVEEVVEKEARNLQ